MTINPDHSEMRQKLITTVWESLPLEKRCADYTDDSETERKLTTNSTAVVDASEGDKLIESQSPSQKGMFHRSEAKLSPLPLPGGSESNTNTTNNNASSVLQELHEEPLTYGAATCTAMRIEHQQDHHQQQQDEEYFPFGRLVGNHHSEPSFAKRRKQTLDNSNHRQAEPPRKKRGIVFNETVRVVPIPLRTEYSARVRERIWSNSFEIQENAIRNTIEFASEGWDWRAVLLDEAMHLCRTTGALIHPIHSCYEPHAFVVHRAPLIDGTRSQCSTTDALGIATPTASDHQNTIPFNDSPPIHE